MLPLLALAVLQQPDTSFKADTLSGLLGKDSLLIRTPVERLPSAKRSPKQGWEFDWTSAGYVGFPHDPSRQELRFELFSQESTQGSARPESVVRALLRLFSYNRAALNLDHSAEFAKVVTVYLCYGGDPGGEQLFDVDNSLGGAKVNTVYFYDLRSFTDPVETTREVAHEYGHATLPAVGGTYTAPEAWSNGLLGEKLYLSYLAEARRKGELGPEDTFGASPEALRAWVRKNVDPLVDDALLNGPRPALLAGKGKASMDAFLGLALLTSRLYGPGQLVRALFIGGTDAKAFPAAAATAAEEREWTSLAIPAELAGKPVWVPVGDADKREIQKRVSNAEVLETRDGWAHLQVRNPTVKVVVRGIKR
jgi:hypothetical protein